MQQRMKDQTLGETIDDHYNTHSEVKKIIAKANVIDKDGTSETWIKDLRSAVSASQKNLIAERNSPQPTSIRHQLNTVRNQKEAGESTTSLVFNKKPNNKRFIFSSRGIRASTGVNLPPKNEIPVICIDKADRENEEIRVKPMFSARRIDSANPTQRSVQPPSSLRERLLLDFKSPNFTRVIQDDTTESSGTGSAEYLAQTDRSLYDKINGYQFKKQERKITNAKFAVIESILPGPHDPASL